MLVDLLSSELVSSVGQICVYAWMDVKKGVIECDWSLFKNATISIEFYYHSLMLSCNMIVQLNSTFFGEFLQIIFAYLLEYFM